jgi:hypothetical protein
MSSPAQLGVAAVPSTVTPSTVYAWANSSESWSTAVVARIVSRAVPASSPVGGVHSSASW